MKSTIIITLLVVGFAMNSQAQSTAIKHSPLNESMNMTETSSVSIQTLRFYPSIISNELTISSNSQLDLVQIHDFSGNLMLETEKPSTTIDVSKIPSGRYILTVYSEGKILKEKMIRV